MAALSQLDNGMIVKYHDDEYKIVAFSLDKKKVWLKMDDRSYAPFMVAIEEVVVDELFPKYK